MISEILVRATAWCQELETFHLPVPNYVGKPELVNIHFCSLGLNNENSRGLIFLLPLCNLLENCDRNICWLRNSFRERVRRLDGQLLYFALFQSPRLARMSKGCRIYVGNLPSDCREKDLDRFFKGYGRKTDVLIKQVRIIPNTIIVTI